MRFIKKVIRTIFILLLSLMLFLIGAGWIKYKNAVSQISIEEAVENIKSHNNYTTIDRISETFVKAVISVEDKRFYTHEGIDIIGLARAINKNLREKSLSQGGSSITQQLAKNMYFLNDRTIIRKIAELFVTFELEEKMSKDEILELYFNVIYYGSGFYNIYDASMGYFNKEPFELSDYESTLLAGIPNAPSVYSPKNNPELAKKRQKIVVPAMVDMNYITSEEANLIVSAD